MGDFGLTTSRVLNHTAAKKPEQSSHEFRASTNCSPTIRGRPEFVGLLIRRIFSYQRS
jgi:hypothetical protein